MEKDTKTYTFSEEEVLGFTNKIKELELKDSLNVSLVQDLEKQISLLEDNAKTNEVIIDFRTQQLQLQKETINLYKEKVKVVKPKWHENKWLWFVYGVGSMISVNLETNKLMKEQIKEVIKKEYVRCIKTLSIF